MGIEKVRRQFYVKGDITIGGDATIAGAATIGGAVVATGNLTATAGTVTFGADAKLVRTGANRVGPATGDTFDAAATKLRLPAPGVSFGTALGTSNLATANPGEARVGFSGATVQFGFVVNGSAFVLSAVDGGTVVLDVQS